MNQAGSSRDLKPVFLLNGRASDIRLGAHLPIHVLPLPRSSASPSIEEIASEHISEIQRAQPFGPYRLLGSAMGGLVAYELASLLLGRDERVEFLGLVDCPRPMERYCPNPLPIPLHYFVADMHSEVEATRAWRCLVGDSLRVIRYSGERPGRVYMDAIEKAPRQEFLQHAANQDFYVPLVTLKVGPPKEVPIFFVPGEGGSVVPCLTLAKGLRERTTIHSLRPRGIDGISVPHSTVEAAAAVYLRAIRHVQPHGPYRLVGYSFGGWVVFELACRLASEGEAVDPIVLIDTETPGVPRETPRRLGRVNTLMRLISLIEEWRGRSIHVSRSELAALDVETQLSWLAQRMKESELLPRSGDVNDIRGLVRVFEANLNTTYEPSGRFPGSAVLFQAAGDVHNDAWGDYVAQLDRVLMAGEHMTKLRRPHIRDIATCIGRRWGT
jgi:thioesterase domain-containing protein